MAEELRQQDKGKRPIAVFDYDGTCIDGQSGWLISWWLLRRGMLSVHSVAGLAWWGIRYKFHLPHRQERARELVFCKLSRLSPAEVERIMVEFHNEVLLPRYRQSAIDEIALRRREGCMTLLVSATFDVIAREAARYLGVDGFAATSMELDAQGAFTGRVSGYVTAGSSKVETTMALARMYAGDDWRLAYAYGDHHSDIELLEAAEHPFVVSPGPTLKRVARRRSWPVLNWKRA